MRNHALAGTCLSMPSACERSQAHSVCFDQHRNHEGVRPPRRKAPANSTGRLSNRCNKHARGANAATDSPAALPVLTKLLRMLHTRRRLSHKDCGAPSVPHLPRYRQTTLSEPHRADDVIYPNPPDVRGHHRAGSEPMIADHPGPSDEPAISPYGHPDKRHRHFASGFLCLFLSDRRNDRTTGYAIYRMG